MRMSMAERPVHTTLPAIVRSASNVRRRASAMRSTDAVTSSGGRVSGMSSSLHQVRIMKHAANDRFICGGRLRDVIVTAPFPVPSVFYMNYDHKYNHAAAQGALCGRTLWAHFWRGFMHRRAAHDAISAGNLAMPHPPTSEERRRCPPASRGPPAAARFWHAPMGSGTAAAQRSFQHDISATWTQQSRRCPMGPKLRRRGTPVGTIAQQRTDN